MHLQSNASNNDDIDLSCGERGRPSRIDRFFELIGQVPNLGRGNTAAALMKG